MSEANDGGAAYPTTPIHNGYDDKTFGNGTGSGTGMTLRDYFAAAALRGWLASFPGDMPFPENRGVTAIAIDCYAMADAMLAARTTPEQT